VRGQHLAKRALEIAAAGGHSMLMIGPPGAGKSMLAARLPGLLPPMSEIEAIEVAAIASVSQNGFDVIAGVSARSAARITLRRASHSLAEAVKSKDFENEQRILRMKSQWRSEIRFISC
jgi:predicted ATPase with chaperone activity